MRADPFDIETEQADAEALKKAEAQELRWEIEDWVWLMGQKKGRRIMWRLLANAGVYRASYVQGDALQTAYNEGARGIGNRILAIVAKHASEAYGLMVKERTDGR